MKKHSKTYSLVAVREYSGGLLAVDADGEVKKYIGDGFSTGENHIAGKELVPSEKGVYQATCEVTFNGDECESVSIVSAKPLYKWGVKKPINPAETEIKEGTRKINIWGDRNCDFMKAYFELPEVYKRELRKVIRVIPFDGYELMVFEQQ